MTLRCSHSMLRFARAIVGMLVLALLLPTSAIAAQVPTDADTDTDVAVDVDTGQAPETPETPEVPATPDAPETPETPDALDVPLDADDTPALDAPEPEAAEGGQVDGDVTDPPVDEAAEPDEDDDTEADHDTDDEPQPVVEAPTWEISPVGAPIADVTDADGHVGRVQVWSVSRNDSSAAADATVEVAWVDGPSSTRLVRASDDAGATVLPDGCAVSDSDAASCVSPTTDAWTAISFAATADTVVEIATWTSEADLLTFAGEVRRIDVTVVDAADTPIVAQHAGEIAGVEPRSGALHHSVVYLPAAPSEVAWTDDAGRSLAWPDHRDVASGGPGFSFGTIDDPAVSPWWQGANERPPGSTATVMATLTTSSGDGGKAPFEPAHQCIALDGAQSLRALPDTLSRSKVAVAGGEANWLPAGGAVERFEPENQAVHVIAGVASVAPETRRPWTGGIVLGGVEYVVEVAASASPAGIWASCNGTDADSRGWVDAAGDLTAFDEVVDGLVVPLGAIDRVRVRTIGRVPWASPAADVSEGGVAFALVLQVVMADAVDADLAVVRSAATRGVWDGVEPPSGVECGQDMEPQQGWCAHPFDPASGLDGVAGRIGVDIVGAHGDTILVRSAEPELEVEEPEPEPEVEEPESEPEVEEPESEPEVEEPESEPEVEEPESEPEPDSEPEVEEPDPEPEPDTNPDPAPDEPGDPVPPIEALEPEVELHVLRDPSGTPTDLLVVNRGNAALGGLEVRLSDPAVVAECSHVIGEVFAPGATSHCFFAVTSLAADDADRSVSVTAQPLRPQSPTDCCTADDVTSWPLDPFEYRAEGEPILEILALTRAHPELDVVVTIDDRSAGTDVAVSVPPGRSVEAAVTVTAADADVESFQVLLGGQALPCRQPEESDPDRGSCVFDLAFETGRHELELTVAVTTRSGNSLISELLVPVEARRPRLALTVAVDDASADDAVVVEWLVLNEGRVPLTEISVVPDHEGIECDDVPALLHPGDVMTCRLESDEPGAFDAVVEVLALAARVVDDRIEVTSHDPVSDRATATWTHVPASIRLQSLSSDGADVSVIPGPLVEPGRIIGIEHTITNDGGVPLLDVTAISSSGLTLVCETDSTVLTVGSSMRCTEQRAVTAGASIDSVTITATPAGPDGAPLFTDVDELRTTASVHVVGARPSVAIETLTQGQADSVGSGPVVAEGELVERVYVVTNDGGFPLLDLAVSDDDPDVIPDCGDGDSVVPVLLPDRVARCFATLTAVGGQHQSQGRVVAQPGHPIPGIALGSSADSWPGDRSAYEAAAIDVVHGVDRSALVVAVDDVSLQVFTNGVDADLAPGTLLAPGSVVTWTLTATNTSAAPLVNASFSLDNGAIPDCGDGTATVAVIEPAASVVCSAVGSASTGATVVTGRVEAQPAESDGAGGWQPIADAEGAIGTDPTHHFGADASIDIETSTNDEDADDEPGVSIPGRPADRVAVRGDEHRRVAARQPDGARRERHRTRLR